MIRLPDEYLRIGAGSAGPEGCRPETQAIAAWTPALDGSASNPVVPTSAFQLINSSTFEWHRVSRPPGRLRLHPTLVRLKLINSAIELDQALLLQGRSLRETILITASGTVIWGFRAWHQAVSDDQPFVDCVEYSFSDEEAIEFILIQHRPRRAWNNFIRVRLALEREPYYERLALTNQIAGGKYKGSANLPKAAQIEVREKIAGVAGVGGRTVFNVKTILKKAASRLIDALQEGTLSINQALQWCSLPQRQQVERFREYTMGRATDKIIRHTLDRSPIQSPCPDPGVVLHALQQQATREPGSIEVRPAKGQKTIILIGQDLWSDLNIKMELPCDTTIL